MANQIDKVYLKTTNLISRIARSTSSVDVATEYWIFAFTTVAFLLFSLDFDADEQLKADVEECYNTLRKSQAVLGVMGHVPWMYNVDSWFPGLIPQNGNFTRLARKMVQQRRNSQIEPDVPDLFTYLLPTESDSNSAGFPLEWEARVAMVAGSGPVSTVLTVASFYLACNASALQNLRQEVDPLLESNRFDPRVHYPILDSVISESIRLQPLVPNGGERVTPPGGMRIGNEYIPGDTVVRVPSYSLFRDKRYFCEPEKWIPERWTTRKELVKDSGAFIPFSAGPYNCVGRPLGMVEIRLVLARLAHTFDISLAKGQSATTFEQSGKDHFGLVFDSLLLDFAKREKDPVEQTPRRMAETR